jgi:hypothetical protein
MQRSHPQDGLVFSASSHFLQQNNSHVCSFIRDGRYCASPEFARGMGSCYRVNCVHLLQVGFILNELVFSNF